MSLAGVIVMCAVFWATVALARSWPRSAAGYRRPATRSGREPRTHYRTAPDAADAGGGGGRSGPVYEYRDRTLDAAALRAMRDRSVLRDRFRR